jgi:cytochrome c oxidase assembly factor CtaG
MPPEFQSVLLDWNVPPLTTLALLLTALVYVRGWLLIGRTRPEQFPEWRLGCFLGGLFSLFLAVASPLDTLDDRLLSAHMGQHFVFMSVAPPLLLLGAPQVPLLRGLPRAFVRRVLGPLLRLHWLRKIGRFLTSLKPAWLLMNIAYIGWHIPKAYELALRSEGWHNVEHACFFLTSVLFWWPILRPWPSHFTGSRWFLLPYLMAADVVNTAISAFLCFADRVVYPSYALEPRLFGISAMADQAGAGALMWVFGSIVFLIPAMVITLQLLSPRRHRVVMRSVARSS